MYPTVSRSSSGFILLSCPVDLLVKCHRERHTEELGGKQRLTEAEAQIGHVASKATHLYDQHTHGDCSQEVFVVIQPLLHLLIAALKMGTGHVSSSENPYRRISCICSKLKVGVSPISLLKRAF